MERHSWLVFKVDWYKLRMIEDFKDHLATGKDINYHSQQFLPTFLWQNVNIGTHKSGPRVLRDSMNKRVIFYVYSLPQKFSFVLGSIINSWLSSYKNQCHWANLLEIWVRHATSHLLAPGSDLIYKGLQAPRKSDTSWIFQYYTKQNDARSQSK